MPRPRKHHRLCFQPKSYYFKPQGLPLRNLQEITLKSEEIEAFKLKHYDQLDQHQAAHQMNTSQSTFQRILSRAQSKIASALVEGSALRIEEKS